MLKSWQISILALVAVSAEAAPRQSTITFGESARVSSGPAKKRNFRQDLDAVAKSHEAWKKAHLNEKLYACQRNPEQVALLARKVADRIGATEKEALKQAKAVEGTVENAIGPESTEMPSELDGTQLATLRAKAQQLTGASKQAQLLERLSGQVMKFYQVEAPRESAVSGNCESDYRVALEKGRAASEQYHGDAASLSDKLTKLTAAAKIALRAAETRWMVALSK